MSDILLEGKGLTKYYKRNIGLVKGKEEKFAAIDHVDFSLKKGEALGIVGESGSGKTTLARCIADIRRLDEGAIYDKSEEMTAKRYEKGNYRQRVRLIYQDSFSSFDPKRTFLYSLREVLALQKEIPEASYNNRIEDVLKDMFLTMKHAERYPHELSGGQCQRMNIARAMLFQPEVLILDEPISSLDVTLQVQVLDLLKELQEKRKLSYIIITHDLRSARYICDDIGVMYHGKLVEHGRTDEIFEHTVHEYTKKLISKSW